MKLGLAAIAVAAALGMGACSSLERVGASEFVRGARRGQLDSGCTMRVLAVTDERAYLEKCNLASSSSSKPVITVLWTPVVEFSAEELREVRELVSPR